MFREIPDLLTPGEVCQLRDIAARSQFVDGRITNPHSTVKNNLQLHDAQAYRQSSQLILDAMNSHEDFQNFAFPAAIAPPMMTRYTAGMRYGAHHDMAYIRTAEAVVRSDLSCTIFLNDPEAYEGGALRVTLGNAVMRFKSKSGGAIVYPSDTLHEVEEVLSGERLVAITFMQSRIKDPWRRAMLYELNEVAALEGLNMAPDNFARLQLVQQNLLRYWGDKP
jgi:PKHD-type hydroxylase